MMSDLGERLSEEEVFHIMSMFRLMMVKLMMSLLAMMMLVIILVAPLCKFWLGWALFI